jgi:transposase
MKKRKPTKPVFKCYVMNQISLMPRSYEEVIPQNHLVRRVNEAVEDINIDGLLGQYVGGGTSSYHPKMMLKVLVYAYCKKIYTSRKIAEALEENLYFKWIAAENTPDFRTINEFRGKRMKAVIAEVFSAVVEYLIAGGYIKLENYFLDGTKIEADANKHKVVWEKRKNRYEQNVKAQIKELLKVIDEENEKEEAEYGDRDLEAKGGNGSPDVTAEQLKKKIAELNVRLKEMARAEEKEEEEVKKNKSAKQALKKLEKDCLPRLEKYEHQTETLAGRRSYSKTDPDATCMKMKEDRGAEKAWPKPAYNIQIGTEGQYIVGYSVHNNGGDPNCLIEHMEGVRKGLGKLPKNLVADAAYGSEENYAYAEAKRMGNFLKYNTFYQDTHKYRNPEVTRKHQFRAYNFGYDADKDEFICPNQKRLLYLYTGSYKSDNGYESNRRHYECKECQGCPLKSQCTKAKGNRRIQISFKLMEYRRQARENLTSEQGQKLREKRSVEVETVFGDIKHNMGFRRFHLRRIGKAKTEWGLVCIAHNMRKLAG